MKNPMKIQYVRGNDGKVRRAFVIPPKFGLWLLPVFVLMVFTQKIISEKRALKHFRKNYIVRSKIINFYGLPMRILYVEPRPKKVKTKKVKAKTTENIEILTIDMPEQENQNGQN